MMKIETPTGKTQGQLDNEDAMLASLTNIAYSQKPSNSISMLKRYGDRSSRFWFRIETIKELVDANKQKQSKTALVHIDEEVESRLATYKLEIGPSLASKISEVREFFLKEIAPLTLASSGGSIQSKEVVQRLLDSDVDSGIFSRFENMINRAATLKMANFVASYFGLPKEQIPSLLGNTQESSELKELMRAISNLPSKQDLDSVSKSMTKVKNEQNR